MLEKQLVNDVNITLITQKASPLLIPGQEKLGELFEVANQIMGEVADLSDKIHLEVLDYRSEAEKAKQYGVDLVPAALVGRGDVRPARFFGTTSGYEFSTFLQDILDVSTGNIELTPETTSFLEGLQEDLHIRVFTTPT